MHRNIVQHHIPLRNRHGPWLPRPHILKKLRHIQPIRGKEVHNPQIPIHRPHRPGVRPLRRHKSPQQMRHPNQLPRPVHHRRRVPRMQPRPQARIAPPVPLRIRPAHALRRKGLLRRQRHRVLRRQQHLPAAIPRRSLRPLQHHLALLQVVDRHTLRGKALRPVPHRLPLKVRVHHRQVRHHRNPACRPLLKLQLSGVHLPVPVRIRPGEQNRVLRLHALQICSRRQILLPLRLLQQPPVVRAPNCRHLPAYPLRTRSAIQERHSNPHPIRGVTHIAVGKVSVSAVMKRQSRKLRNLRQRRIPVRAIHD